MSRIARELSRFTQKEVDTLFNNARAAIKHAGMTILVAPKQKEFGRILIITSRKVGDSPTRNKIRRQLKALFFEHKLYEREYDCAVIVRKKGTQLPFADLEQLLLQAFTVKKQA